MKLVIFLCVLLAMSAESTSNNQNHFEGRCKLGDIRGSIMKSRLGRDIYSFRGIRYAEPPTGDLRFKQAVPVKPWNGVFDATQECPVCPQQLPEKWIDPMSEDCLRLNIYTTKLPKPGSPTDLRPVLVFFHPGVFYLFSSQSKLWGPQYLLDEDIVLVTVNYRLGALGFISTGDAQAPGNLGLKDQVEALRFVKNHISAFGGDPDSVTISGYSAGAWSVALHLVSPMSRGLFHRAIEMSGSAVFHSPVQNNRMDLAEKQARFLGCPSNSSEEIIRCLKSKSAKEIVDSVTQFDEWRGSPVILWEPVIEPEVPGVERFLHTQPAELLTQGKFNKVPMIIGVTKDEFGSAIIEPVEAARKGDNSYLDDLNANWTRIMPIMYGYERDTPQSTNISEEFRQFYFDNKPISLDNIDGLKNLHIDAMIFSVHRMAKLVSQYSDKPVYFYYFTYQGRYSWSTWSDGKPFGVVHHDDLMYLFHNSILFPYFDANAPEIPTVKRMTSMWANFVCTGQPIPKKKQDFAGITWSPFTPQNGAYLEINENLTMKRNLLEDRLNEWDKLFPLSRILKS